MKKMEKLGDLSEKLECMIDYKAVEIKKIRKEVFEIDILFKHTFYPKPFPRLAHSLSLSL